MDRMVQSTKSDPAVGGAAQPVAELQHVLMRPAPSAASAGRAVGGTMFDQPLAAIASRWRQEFLFHHS